MLVTPEIEKAVIGVENLIESNPELKHSLKPQVVNQLHLAAYQLKTHKAKMRLLSTSGRRR